MTHKILKPGKNCWKIGNADKAAFIVDGAAYFSALADAFEQAKQTIYIAGWDIRSHVRLIRDDGFLKEKRNRFDNILNRVVSENKNLKAYILAWDFSMIFALDREPFLYFKFGWNAPNRIHFHMDDQHAIGASHHQKIVVIDDTLAFVGGIDITKGRWDTPDHALDEPRRVDSEGNPYGPFHDTQMAVQGPVVGMIGDIFRERWERAKGEKLAAPSVDRTDVWPSDVEVEAKNVEVGISRTIGRFGSAQEVREVERLYLDSITSAKRLIYLENQYLTSHSVIETLISRLREENCPEIIIITPLHSTGWLEESTMTQLRAIMVNRLRRADKNNKLYILYPYRVGHGEIGIKVHAKVAIVDDDFLRIGSSNISNRSMGLDTECDLSLESHGRGDIQKAIASFRNRLISEHTGLEKEELESVLNDYESLGQCLANNKSQDRGLKQLEVDSKEDYMYVPPHLSLADPERPIDYEDFVNRFMGEENEVDTAGVGLWKLFALICGLALLAAMWRWGPLYQWLDSENLTNLVYALKKSYLAPFAVIGIYVVAGLLFAPVSVVIGVVALVFSPLESFTYSMLGSLASGVVTFAIGRSLGRDKIQALAGKRLNGLSKRLSKRGLLTVTALRLAPVAPYTLVNLVMAASHVRLSHFILGTALGMLPGILAISVLGEAITDLVFSLDPVDALIFIGLLLIIMFATWLIQGYVKAKIFKGEDSE